MNYLIKACRRYGILDSDIDYHVLRASMVLMFFFFGYQKWLKQDLVRLSLQCRETSRSATSTEMPARGDTLRRAV